MWPQGRRKVPHFVASNAQVTAATLEQQLSKRRGLLRQMCDNIRAELHAGLATPEWQGLAELRDPSTAKDGHRHAEAVLDAELAATSLEAPEYYNDDQKWGDAIARAVAAAQLVNQWPSALKRLCKRVRLDPALLMQARQLTVSFEGFGLAEAEVLELLLRVSTSLHGLTLYDGGMGGDWDEARWSVCIAAVARGVKASRALVSLNLRHFSLKGSAGAAMADAPAAYRDTPEKNVASGDKRRMVTRQPDLS